MRKVCYIKAPAFFLLRLFFVDVTHLVRFVRFAILKIEMLLAEEDRYTFIACMEMVNTCDLSRFVTYTNGKLGKALAVFLLH